MKEEKKKKEEEERAKRDEEMRVKRYDEMRQACICSQFLNRYLDIDCEDYQWTWLSPIGKEECCDGAEVKCNLDEGTPSEYYRWGGVMYSGTSI